MKLTLFFAVAFLAAPVLADTDMLNAQTGIVQVVVQDQFGEPAADVPVYIFNGSRIDSFQTNELGSVSVALQSGKYTISSALSRPKQDWVDRYASRPAAIQLIAQDTTSVILTLNPVEDPIATLSLSTLQKIGVADQVAKYTN